MGEKHAQRGKIAHDQLSAAIREQLRLQHGNVSRRQLLELGLSKTGIDRRLESGWLARRYHGVYCQAPARQDPPALIAAAVLAGGSTALASHTSAAFLWDFLPHFKPPPEISLPAGDRRPRHILTHRCPSLHPADNSLQHGVKVTSRARTLLDIAPGLTANQLTRLVNDQLRRKMLRQAALQDVLTRNPRHPGSKLLTPFLDLPGTNPTNSRLEDAFLPFLAKHGLPIPLINHLLHGYEVDAYFPDHDLVAELDGWGYHNDRRAFETDRERDAHHLQHGTPTVRITEDRVTATPEREASRLQQILDQCLQRKKPSSSQTNELEEG